MMRLLTLFALLALAAGPARAQVKVTPLTVNTADDEDDSHVSSSGLTLFYTATARKKSDIMMSRRRDKSQSWPAGKPVEDYVSTETDDRSAFATTDGRYPQFLYFATKKDKTSKNFDIYVTVRQTAASAFSSPTPLQTVCTEEDELHPWLTADGKGLYFSRKTKDGWRVYVARRKEATGGGGFGEPSLVKELPAGFHHATLTPDGKTMYLQGPLDKGRWGLFRSVLGADGWEKPEALEALNNGEGPTGDRSPGLSRDGSMLYFASDRPGGKGGLDLYAVATADLKKK
jgi:Tol biopolymer transport system component